MERRAKRTPDVQVHTERGVRAVVSHTDRQTNVFAGLRGGLVGSQGRDRNIRASERTEAAQAEKKKQRISHEGEFSKLF
jgi:membrane protease subunit (stomatin/prohibitin family)